MIAVVDYGAGNLQSVANALDAAGAEYRLVAAVRELQAGDKIILPGVGHFGQMMRALERRGLGAALCESIRGGVPFLGICLGFQALLEASEEAPGVEGLGIWEGTVRRFPAGTRVPHMGWNTIDAASAKESILLRATPARPHLYFAHSYYVPQGPPTVATCTYAVAFAAVAEAGTIFGVQFHPEKSGPLGVHLLKNFAEC
jgi:imidazole glycerol phosphate synthase glutamine amidotransferase subunit